jgi:Flp pilus assembly protein TadG
MFCCLVQLRIMIARTACELARLRVDQRGNVAVMMGFLLPILISGLGMGFEVGDWYLQTRAMQNAADSAAIAAAANASANYGVEAKAVAAQYGFVDGVNNVTVTPSNTATCPSGGNTCYSVTITSLVPLYVIQVVGYQGDTTVGGAKQKSLTSLAIAKQGAIQQPLCLLALNQSGVAIRSNGGPNTNFSGCSIMSDANATCNGSNMQATYGLAHGTSSNCGNTQVSNVPIVPDPYSGLVNNIPTLPTCSSYPQETVHGSHVSGGNTWAAGSSWPAGYTSTSSGGVTYIQVCGDLRLQGNVTINAAGPTVLVIENGQLDLYGNTLTTSNVAVVFSGTSGSYTHAPTDNSGGGTLDVQAPTSGPWSGVALYQNPNLTSGVDVSYAGNSPTWDISGLVYMPNANVTVSGAVGKSLNGAACMVMVAGSVLVNGTGSFYSQTPAGCAQAGLTMPTATIPGRSTLVY